MNDTVKDTAKALARALIESHVAGLKRALDVALESGNLDVATIRAKLDAQQKLNEAWALANEANAENVVVQRQQVRAMLVMLLDGLSQAALSAF